MCYNHLCCICLTLVEVLNLNQLNKINLNTERQGEQVVDRKQEGRTRSRVLVGIVWKKKGFVGMPEKKVSPLLL